MRLREGKLEDAAALVALTHEAFEEYRLRLDPPSAAHDETVETVEKKLRSGGTAVVAEIDGGAAGFVFLEPREDCVYFSRLSVRPAFRNRGIASRLIDDVERRAAASGARCVRLGVRVQLPELIALYERRGYRITEYRRHPGYAEPTFVFMEKLIGV